MNKKHLLSFVDAHLIIFLIITIVLCGIITLLFSDKVKDFAKQYKKKFYGYVLSFVVLYALVAFLGHNKLFIEVTNEFLFYQIASLIFGILHVCSYRWYFQEFNISSYLAELLFLLIVPLYSSVLFVIIYTALNGIDFTFLMCSNFLVFLIPTGIYMTFNIMMLIPARKIVTWTPAKDYHAIKSNEMEDILLITIMIKKEESDIEYASLRAQAPVRVNFGRLFFLAVSGYNASNPNAMIALDMTNGESCNWVFYLQPKWYEKIKYIDADYPVGINGITENSIIVCQRETAKNTAPEKKKKPDERLYGIDSHNQGAEAKQIEAVEGKQNHKVK